MDLEKEKSFIRNFIDKSFQDRLIWELQGKKRREGIHKFSHKIDKIINSKYIVVKLQKISPEECLDKIKEYSKSKTCYIISDEHIEKNLKLDGKEFEIEEAIYTFFYLYFGAVMIIDSHTVMLKSEQEYGPSCKYILYREKIIP